MKRFRCRTFVLNGALACAAVFAPAVYAQATYTFSLPAQALDESIKAVASRTGTTVVFEPGAIGDRSAPALQGSYSAQQALEHLLQDSGLVLERTDGGSLIVIAPGAQRTGEGAGANVVSLEEIVVTGTLLSEAALTSPLLVIDRSEIERRGAITIQEVLQQTSQSFSGVNSSTTRVTSGNTGLTSQADLRGLGSEATLTLVNGRRLTSASGDVGRAVDLSFIPTVAIERVEILTDGASALYGSDAIGGVLNLILRKDFEGVETSAFYGLNESGSDRSSLSGAAGMSWDGGQMMIAAQHTRQAALHFGDIGIASADLRGFGGGDYRVAFAGQPGNVLPLGYFAGMPFSTVTGPGGAPVYSAALPDGSSGPLAIADLRLNALNAGDILPEQITPESRANSFYATAQHDFGPLELFADVIYSHRKTLFPSFPYVNVLMVMPQNAFSPFLEPVLVGYVDDQLYGDPGDVQNEGWAVTTGVRGYLGAGWRWEVVGSASGAETELRPSSIDEVELARRLASSDPTVAFNPFASSSAQAPGVAEAVREILDLDSETSLTSFSGLVSGALFQMPAGRVQLAAGAEHRTEKLDDVYVRDASRDVTSVFAELYLPLFSDLNARPGLRELGLSAAARFDDFSDFGSTVNPKIGMRWQPAERWLVKANYGTSFRAPLLNQLFFNRSAPHSQVVFDPNAPGGGASVITQVVQGGNPELKEETAETVSVGVSHQPRWLEGAHWGVNYFSIDYQDRIRGALEGINTGTLLQFENQLPAGVVVRDSAGNLQRLNVVNINSALTKVEGIDFMAGYVMKMGALGKFNIDLNGTRYTKYDDQLFETSPVLDLAGRLGSLAQWRGRVDFGWSRDALGALLSVVHVDGLRNEEADPRIVARQVDSQTVVDFQMQFRSPATSGLLHGFVARLGVKNLSDEPSPFVDSPMHFGVDAQNYVIDGRTFYLSLSKALGAAALK